MPRRDQWIFKKPCGCPVGVMEGYLADTADEAFVEMYETDKDVASARARGISAEMIAWAEYEATYLDKMKFAYQCTHAAA